MVANSHVQASDLQPKLIGVALLPVTSHLDLSR